MWFPDGDTLKQADPSTAFMLLGWAELYDSSTPDSFRARLLDTAALVRELGFLAEIATSDPRMSKHLLSVRDELFVVANEDEVLQRRHPQAAAAIAGMNGELHADRFRILTNVLTEDLREYDNWLADDLRDAADHLPKEKNHALKALRRVASLASRRGHIPAPDEQPVNIASLSLSPNEAVGVILDSLTHHESQWRCVVGLIGNRDDLRRLINGTGFAPFPKRDKPLGSQAQPFHAAVGDNYLAQANVTGSSPHRAVEAALGPLRRTLDVANFHCHESAFEIAPVVWLETDGRSRAYSLSVETGGGLKPQHLAVERVKELRNEGVIGRLPDRLIASLEQHSIAYSTSDPKVRFTNLWAALETLTGKAVDETIVDRITRCVVPMIVHRRPSKVIKYLAICLQEFGLVGTYTDESRCFTRSKASFVRPDELLLALTGAMGDAAVYELLSFTSGHSLLCNRISREAETFHDPKLLSKQLADSERRTCWQLLRIYRARNLLIHAGHRGEFLEQLLSNLEAYYSLAVGRVISDLRTNVGFGVDESFESRRMRLDYVRTQLQRAPSVLTVLDVLPEGDNDSTAPLPWPPAS